MKLVNKLIYPSNNPLKMDFLMALFLPSSAQVQTADVQLSVYPDVKPVLGTYLTGCLIGEEVSRR